MESIALPRALEATGFCLPRRCAHGSDCICRGTEFVGRDMGDRRGLSSGMGGLPGRPGHLPAAAFAAKAAVRLSLILTTPRVHARPNSIARRGRSSSGRACFAVAMGVMILALGPTLNDVGPTAPVDPDWHERRG